MKKTATALIMALSVFAADLNGQEYTGPFSHSLETVSRFIEMLKEAGLVEYQK